MLEVEDIEDVVGPGTVGPKDRAQKERILPRSLRKKPEAIQREVPEGDSFIPGGSSVYVKTWGCTHNTSDGEYMAGLLAASGYVVVDAPLSADVWLLNSCTVKSPSEASFLSAVEKGRDLGKVVVVAGCVPQGQKKHTALQGLSAIGVQQIDRVVEVVEQALQGHTVRLLGPRRVNRHRQPGPNLDLPKIRKNPLIEIIPINSGCLNHCTYCKTKHARGDLASYPPEEIVGRARQAFAEGVVELWLTSEDTGAYGRDIDASLPELLWKVVQTVPDGSMLRLGMTNPPYILQHLEEMSRILAHPRVYSFLHVPVQSGSNCVLEQMKREYIVEDFRHVVDYLLERVPGITIATDVICGFPSETSEDFEETMELVREYRFPVLFINQFYPRPGTAAARMKRLPTQEVKGRSRRLSKLFHSYLPYEDRVGKREKVLVTERASDGHHFVGHDKSYRQVLVPGDSDSLMGRMVDVEIASAGKHYLVGRLLLSCDPTPHSLTKSRVTPSFLVLTSVVMVFVVAMVTKLLLPLLSSAP